MSIILAYLALLIVTFGLATGARTYDFPFYLIPWLLFVALCVFPLDMIFTVKFIKGGER